MEDHTIAQLNEELQEFMETIIARKGKTYGSTLSVWLGMIALERMHIQMHGNLCGVVRADVRSIPVLIQVPAFLGETTERLKTVLHETIHISGNLIAQERKQDCTCTELDKELQEDMRMFLKKELEYMNGKKGVKPE